jgi:hypothetical protein
VRLAGMRNQLVIERPKRFARVSFGRSKKAAQQLHKRSFHSRSGEAQEALISGSFCEGYCHCAARMQWQ